MRVLCVEDDELIGQAIRAGLRRDGIDVVHVTTATQAEAAVTQEAFHALILDLGLPDKDGLDLLKAIRAIEPNMPILIVSARDAIEHRLTGLHQGADDYLIKPFDLRELAARVHVLLRRTLGRSSQWIHAGPLRLEPATGQAWLYEQAVQLSRREIDLIAHLANARNSWMRSEVLNERLFGLHEEVGSNALNVHIHNIRKKLGNEAIENSRGLGYRLGWKVEP